MCKIWNLKHIRDNCIGQVIITNSSLKQSLQWVMQTQLDQGKVYVYICIDSAM